MTEKEKEAIDESIMAYKRMIKYFENQISILQSKKTDKCCFQKKIKHRFKIKSVI